MVPVHRIRADSKLNTILLTKFEGDYVEVGPDRVILPKDYEKYQEKITNFEVRDDDVYILAFPKAGMRWTQETVWLLMNNLDFEKAREVDMLQRSPLLEMEVLHEHFKNYFEGINELSGPRCIASHFAWSLLPKSLKDDSKQPKMIVVLRGPEDTCLSYYHHMRVLHGFNGSFEEFCDLFLEGKVRFGSYWNHVLGFWNQRHKPNVMFLKYDEMKADLAGSIRKVAGFLGKGLSDEGVAAMCEHLSFDNLKTSKGFNFEYLMNRKGCETNPFIRTGTVGGHKEVMSAKIIAAFKTQRELYFQGAGLSID